MSRAFHISLTGDFYHNGNPVYPDFDLRAFEQADGLTFAPFPDHRPEIAPEQLQGSNAVIVLSPQVTERSLAGLDDLLVVSRFGVGYDSVAVDACTQADTVLCITTGAVDRPVAEATLGWMIALAHQVYAKDRLVRTGRWDERSGLMGSELRDRTLGIIGLGGIGRALLNLLQGFGMRPALAHDPFVDPATAARLGVELVELDRLLQDADFVSLHCPLNAHTRGLLGARELALMKPEAYLINTARGGIVDEDALFDALASRQIAGAAVDCFAEEPLPQPPRYSDLDNVLLAPHCIAWTHEMFRDIGAAACQNIIDLAHGRRPRAVVNPEVFERPTFQKKWKRLRLSPG